MLLSLFLLSYSFVTVVVDRNEIESNLSKKQINAFTLEAFSGTGHFMHLSSHVFRS